MYALGRRVWVKPLDTLGTIKERGWSYEPPRRAAYVVLLEAGIEFHASPDDLRAADWGCDGCNRWLPGRPYATAPDGEYPNGLQFCWVCAGTPIKDRMEREEMKYYESLKEIV